MNFYFKCYFDKIQLFKKLYFLKPFYKGTKRFVSNVKKIKTSVLPWIFSIGPAKSTLYPFSPVRLRGWSILYSISPGLPRPLAPSWLLQKGGISWWEDTLPARPPVSIHRGFHSGCGPLYKTRVPRGGDLSSMATVLNQILVTALSLFPFKT